MNMISILISGGLMAVGAAASAHAQGTRTHIVVHVSVPHGDLDLASDAGARTMLDRLSKAASRACGGKPVTAWSQVEEARKREYQRCQTAAMETSISKLGAPLVRAAWLGQQSASSGMRASQVATSDH